MALHYKPGTPPRLFYGVTMEQIVADIPDVFREFEYEKTPMVDGLPSVTLGDA